MRSVTPPQHHLLPRPIHQGLTWPLQQSQPVPGTHESHHALQRLHPRPAQVSTHNGRLQAAHPTTALLPLRGWLPGMRQKGHLQCLCKALGSLIHLAAVSQHPPPSDHPLTDTSHQQALPRSRARGLAHVETSWVSLCSGFATCEPLGFTQSLDPASAPNSR